MRLIDFMEETGTLVTIQAPPVGVVPWSRSLNKGQLIEQVASELGGSKIAASKAVAAVIASIARGIQRDNAVTIAGFGTFAKKERGARTVRNPATGQPLEIEPSRTVTFKPSPSLKKNM